MQKIIVRMPNWVGDFVMALPILQDLKMCYPHSFVTVLASEKLVDLLEGNPYVDSVIGFSRKRRFFPRDSEGRSLIQRIRKGKYDRGILLTNSFSSAWLFFLGKVRKRVGFYRPFRSFLLHKNVKSGHEEGHLVSLYKSILPLSISDTLPTLYVPSAPKEKGKILIGINPGASYGSAKCWLPERFREVAERLIQEIPRSEVLFLGDLSTKALIDQICVDASPRIKNLAGKTTLKELVSLIGGLDLFLTNDSGPMHIGAALKTPLVALFGSTNDRATGPYQWGEVINKRVSCAPCYKRVCPIDFKCMKQIDVDEVVTALKRAFLIRISEKLAKPISFEGAQPPLISSPSLKRTRSSGTIILAAGAGRRLGLDMPKGCLEIGGKSLYERALEKAKGPIAIMTSPLTHEKTKAFLEERGYGDVDLFETRCFPRTTRNYSESPEGNGAVFEAFYTSDLWAKWQNVEVISIVPIDNPLADGFDEEMVSGCQDLIVKAIAKLNPDEKVGTLVVKEERLYVSEYSEIPENEKGRWTIAYSGMFSCSRSFFEKAALKELPWHLVEKLDGNHYEKFVFDAFPVAERYDVLLVKREDHFCPIKTKADVALAQELLYNRPL